MKGVSVPLGLVLIVGASLRVFGIGAKGLWLDEALSWRLQQFPLLMMLDRTSERMTVHPPLYFGVLQAWTSCFGDSEAVLRSLSAAAGILTVLGVFFFTSELARFGPGSDTTYARRIRVGSGLLAATLMALSPLHIYLAKQVRGYTLATLLLVLSSWALLRALGASKPDARRWGWLAYAAITVAFCYTHHLALLSVSAQVVFLVLYLWGPGAKSRFLPRASLPETPGVLGAPGSAADVPLGSCRRGAVFATGLILAAYLPWAPRVWAQSENLRTSWTRNLEANDCAREIYAGLLATSGMRPQEPLALSWGVVLVLAGVLVYVAVRCGWAGTYCLLAGTLPVCVVLVYSAFSMRSIFDARYLVFAQVAWLVAFGMAVASLVRRPERYLMACLLIVWVMHGLWDNRALLGSESNPGARGAVAHILQRKEPCELVVVLCPHTFFTTAYYMRRSDSAPVLCVKVPDRRFQFGAAHLVDEDLATAEDVLASAPQGVWLVTSSAFGAASEADFPVPANWEQGERLQFAPEWHVRWDRPIIVQHYHLVE